FAQTFHPSFRHTAAPRRDLGIGTAFNALGPLTNPAQPTYAAVGVADARLAPLMAGVFAGRSKDAVVFRGDDSLDELTVSTTSSVWWVRGGVVREYTLDPRELGLELHPLESLRGGDAVHNAGVVRDVFAGQRGPVRDAVVLNAGIALALTEQDPQGGPGAGTDAGTGAAGTESGTDAGSAAPTGMDHAAFTAQVRAGMDRAERAIDEGAATEVVARWVAATRD
ncbi:MAG: hypothetical protein ACXVYH_06475, partial [Oryzihumus sp.]